MAIFIGSLRSSYTSVETKNILPPASPRLKPLSEATNKEQIEIQGFAEAGTTVEIFLNGVSKQKSVAETDGSFLISHVKLNRDKNEIYATATDQEGYTSQKSGILIIYFDQTPPELTINEPADNSTFYAEEKVIKIQGETEEDVTITINDRFVIVGAGGKFSSSFTLSEGENKIKIVATDKANNQTEKEITVTLE
ncbi:unnamed protein product [marine sediment metagenome]|uniref:Bacterial Ig domain-containing protein n=1 Tax=marine sediment metagenome TaxID=412755 RepID=X1SRY2_9ZZZZ